MIFMAFCSNVRAAQEIGEIRNTRNENFEALDD